jgi:hypothetical protein
MRIAFDFTSTCVSPGDRGFACAPSIALRFQQNSDHTAAIDGIKKDDITDKEEGGGLRSEGDLRGECESQVTENTGYKLTEVLGSSTGIYTGGIFKGTVGLDHSFTVGTSTKLDITWSTAYTTGIFCTEQLAAQYTAIRVKKIEKVAGNKSITPTTGMSCKMTKAVEITTAFTEKLKTPILKQILDDSSELYATQLKEKADSFKLQVTTEKEEKITVMKAEIKSSMKSKISEVKSKIGDFKQETKDLKGKYKECKTKVKDIKATYNASHKIKCGKYKSKASINKLKSSTQKYLKALIKLGE